MLSNLRQYGYFVDVQLMDFDNQKGLWERSLSMRKNKNYYPNFRVAKSDIFDREPQAEQTTEDFMKTQESFDDSAFEKDLGDADMADSTTPETEYTFLGVPGTDVFSQKPFSNKKPKTFEG
eukprot:13360412-Alexandrium_andersonii.AAC.1